MKLLLLLPLSLLADSVDHLKREEVLDIHQFGSQDVKNCNSPSPRGEEVLDINQFCSQDVNHCNSPSKVPGSQVEGLPPGGKRMTFKPPQLSDEEVINIIHTK